MRDGSLGRLVRRQFVGVVLGLTSTACSYSYSEIPARNAAIHAALRYVSEAVNDQAPDPVCGMADGRVFGRSNILPFTASKPTVNELAVDRSFDVEVSYWCSGRETDGSRNRISRTVALRLERAQDGAFTIRDVRVLSSSPLNLSRQFLPWFGLLLFAPLIIYAAIVCSVTYAAVMGGQIQFVAGLAALELSDIPPWARASLRLAGIALVGWAGLIYFGGWLAAFVSALGLLLVAPISEPVYMSLALAIVRLAVFVVVIVVSYLGVPIVATALGIWLILSGHDNWAVVAGVGAIITSGFVLRDDDIPKSNGLLGIVSGLLLVVAGIAARFFR